MFLRSRGERPAKGPIGEFVPSPGDRIGRELGPGIFDADSFLGTDKVPLNVGWIGSSMNFILTGCWYFGRLVKSGLGSVGDGTDVTGVKSGSGGAGGAGGRGASTGGGRTLGSRFESTAEGGGLGGLAGTCLA